VVEREKNKTQMNKHLHILTLIFSTVSLITSTIAGKDLFTVLGWFTATMTSATTIIYFKMLENKDKGD